MERGGFSSSKIYFARGNPGPGTGGWVGNMYDTHMMVWHVKTETGGGRKGAVK